MKIIRLIKFPIKNGVKKGDVLWPLLSNCALEYAIRTVHVDQNGLKLSGKHQVLVYADDINIMSESLRSVNKNSEALLVADKETGLEVMWHSIWHNLQHVTLTCEPCILK
jgi:hypothetical protein